ncbi:hypothetical protein GVAV_000480 [Gurleya vavrai]
MRTLITSFLNFPKLKPFVLDLMLRLVKREIWNFKRLYAGFLILLGIMKNDCLEVLMIMPIEKIKNALKKPEIMSICEKQIKNDILRGPNGFKLKNIIYGELKKTKK